MQQSIAQELWSGANGGRDSIRIKQFQMREELWLIESIQIYQVCDQVFPKVEGQPGISLLVGWFLI